MPRTQAAVPAAAPATFGDMLKYLRRRARLTQRDLSIAVGYSEAHLSRLEHNQRLPDLTTLVALFVPVLHLDDAPELVARFLALAAAARGAGAAPAPPTEEPVLGGMLSVNSLPAASTALIGREQELAEVERLLQLPACRIVTITGLGGSGKTRLAIVAATARHHAYADGAAFVSLAPLTSPTLIVPTIADAVGCTLPGYDAPLDHLGRYLRNKHVLLVLDNAEHVLAGVNVLSEIAKRAPNVTLLVTSRERLNLHDEWVVALRGLALPRGAAGAGAARHHHGYAARHWAGRHQACRREIACMRLPPLRQGSTLRALRSL